MLNFPTKRQSVTTALACALALAMTAHFLIPTSTQSADVHYESHALAGEQLAMLTHFPASATLWLD